MKGVGEEWVFVWGLEASNERVELLPFPQSPIEEAELAVGDFEGAGLVDCTVEGELDSFDEVEGYGVF